VEKNILYAYLSFTHPLVEKNVNNQWLFIIALAVSSEGFPQEKEDYKSQFFLFYIAIPLYNLWKTS
jgi:hypothetical protein